MMILISGPYRSGTNDDPQLIRANLQRLEDAALPIYRKGHIPIIGEWVALPLMKMAGSKQVGDFIYNDMSYPIAHSLLRKCDAILRIKGASKGADQDVALGKELGLKIYCKIEDIPNATKTS
ncbi:MAG: DUF4406 domain-containing protein [Bacteroidota bacterium]